MCFQRSIHLQCRDSFGYATFFFSSFRETCSIATDAADVSELQLRLTQQQLREKEEEYQRIEREKEDMESQLSEADKKTRSLRNHLNDQQMQYQRSVCVCVCVCVCGVVVVWLCPWLGGGGPEVLSYNKVGSLWG